MTRISNRLQKLRRGLEEKDIDGIFISQPENRRYLSGFDGSAGFLLITKQNATLATDFRYTEQAKAQASDYEIFRINNHMADWLLRLSDRLEIRRLGFEAEHVTFTAYRQLSDILDGRLPLTDLIPLNGLVESLRAVKEPEETELIARAAAISDSAFEHIKDIIHAGMNEKSAAWVIEQFLRDNGSQTIPFDIIVASGPNSALPHARPSMRTINEGEPVLIDMGARFEGYSSDLSRTIYLGTPDDTFKKIYDIVLNAQLTAISIIKEGMTGEQADSSARKAIGQAGYGEHFGHALGHGIGLAPHESPRLGPASTDILTSGMVFTIEPGIYLPGWGGVRIEDLVVIEDGQARVISKARKV
ncbi:M24 family metallopeptidase [Chloroflexota bacterium]